MSEELPVDLNLLLERRLEDVELKCMDLENAMAEINEVVIKQYQEIDQLNSQLERIRGQISGLESGSGDNSDDPPPPHY